MTHDNTSEQEYKRPLLPPATTIHIFLENCEANPCAVCRLSPSVSNPPTNLHLIGIAIHTIVYTYSGNLTFPLSSSEIKLQIATMPEIKQPNTTNSDAAWEHILSYQRFVVQTGAVNLWSPS